MSDHPLKAITTVVIAGRERRLRYDCAALAELQTAGGFQNIGDLLLAISSPGLLPRAIEVGIATAEGSCDLTVDEISHLDFPILMAVDAVVNAVRYALHGPNPPEASEAGRP